MEEKGDGARWIKEFRLSRDQKQAEFAADVRSSQGQVSLWESGEIEPSTESWIRMAALAAPSDPERGAYCLNRAGLDSKTLSEIAGQLLKDGEIEMEGLLAAVVAVTPKSEAILNAARVVLESRMVNRLTLGDKLVRVPRYDGDATPVDPDDEPPLHMPSDLGETVGGLRYFEAPDEKYAGPGAERGFSPGDRIVYDVTNAGATMLQLEFEMLLVNFAGQGLFVGRLGVVNVGMGSHESFAVVLAPVHNQPVHFSPERKRIAHRTHDGQVPRGYRVICYGERANGVEKGDKAELEVLKRRPPKGVEIRGRVVAILPAKWQRE